MNRPDGWDLPDSLEQEDAREEESGPRVRHCAECGCELHREEARICDYCQDFGRIIDMDPAPKWPGDLL